MIKFLLLADNLPFTVSLTIMLLLAVLEGVALILGMGFSSILETLIPDININVDGPDTTAPGMISSLLGWLYIGKVPFLIVLILLLTFFGLCGLLIQAACQTLIGVLLPSWIAVIPALITALPITRQITTLTIRFIPETETEAVSGDSFIGRVAKITTGTAKHDYPAQAKVRDQHGLNHYIMVEPDLNQSQIEQGSHVLLVRKKNTVFIVIPNSNPNLINN
ncbi:YqiJ family protein [Amphritea balenae]|uniref:DUF1449 family protein n=1 Tax=Amphritea balenae TaxID=452629 RepID=A0A3P1SQA9_9GAMM|nr:YqiJ family protein [Amphritea balenae]RRC98825.1 DUF1449 family protein [Amphritea balenae]GGK62086.1 hypothetical protein GCM10007941_10230 [Amphritea balenae]